MILYGKTDIGKVRDTNQDTFAYGEPIEEGCFALVCDGMGGQNGGNIASQSARDKLTENFVRSMDSNMSTQDIKSMMMEGFKKANLSIYDKSKINDNLHGMGTTIVAAATLGDYVCIGHVGDSRAYLYADGLLTQITSDHSFVQLLVERGKISKEDAKDHPRRNEITRAIGVSDYVETDILELNLREKNRILLCSDGLTGVCTDEEICEILKSSDSKQSVERLINLANDHGGKDNITVVVIENN